MSTTTRTAHDPFDDGYWRAVGTDGGRRNDPRTPGGPATARSLLQSAWRHELRMERVAFLDELDALNKRRTTIRRQLHEVRTQAACDPRQAAAVSMLMEEERKLGDGRVLVCERFLQAVDRLTQQAHECDAIWRAENERHRDRRISISPTELSVPADIVDIPTDPFA